MLGTAKVSHTMTAETASEHDGISVFLKDTIAAAVQVLMPMYTHLPILHLANWHPNPHLLFCPVIVESKSEWS